MRQQPGCNSTRRVYLRKIRGYFALQRTQRCRRPQSRRYFIAPRKTLVVLRLLEFARCVARTTKRASTNEDRSAMKQRRIGIKSVHASVKATYSPWLSCCAEDFEPFLHGVSSF